ncbi:MAG: leucyl/phenylalanyl-tRNA--protein transferase, partial [Oleibacter sp.]|nr:leucyl/phenylalanyl-tRNA--protein transferase [Thalassolituus sp.]
MIDWLNESNDPNFPSTAKALKDPSGLLAAGGLVSPRWIDAAYRQGIFPWNDPSEVRLWWSPMPRAIITPTSFHLPKRLARECRNTTLRVTTQLQFKEVMKGCAAPRKEDGGTWIDREILATYPRCANAGRALSVECWATEGEYLGQLVGGFYGLIIGRVLFGESMFSRVSGASRIAFGLCAPKLFEMG